MFNLKGISNYEIIERDIYDDYIFQNLKRTFNIIFVDPPYKDNNFHKIFTRIKNFKVLNKNGILILHRHKNDKNIFFKKDGSLKRVTTNFMKECLLESLKRLVSDKCDTDINDEESELNSDIITYIEGSNRIEDHFYTYPDVYENDIADKLYQKEEFNKCFN